MHSKVTAAVIGIGNPARGDDGAGREVARLLADLRQARVVETNGDATDLLEIWRGVETCVIIDAVSSGERPGFIHRLRVQEAELPDVYDQCSSHAFGLPTAIELARVFDELPQNLIVYGIEAGSFALGAPLSRAVREAIPIVAERVRDELRELQGAIP